MKKLIQFILIFLLLINGLTAIYGGGLLIYDSSGTILQIPLELLDYSPFSNFLVPGMVLFLGNGVLNLYTAIIGMRKSPHFPAFTALCGLFLLSWLTIQIVIISEFYPYAHIPYYVIGSLLFIGGMILWKTN